MKKSLIALAVAGTFAAPAFAATSNVDIYGVINVSVSRIDSDVTGTDNSTSITSNASRIGFKGTEDLGGGLAAIWQIESGFNADESATTPNTFASRNTFIGLKGGFGTVLAGRHDTPMKLLGRSVDNFGDTLADSRNLLGADRAGGASIFDLRTDNTIAYISPSFSGLTLIGAYVADHTPAGTVVDNNDRDAYSVSGNYANGPLMLGLGYERHNTTGADRSMWRLVGGYTIGDLKLGAQYENGKNDGMTPNADRNGWGLFANYAMGNITLKANYLTVGDTDTVANTAGKQYTVGADYALSKRTTAYALYAKIKNDSAATFNLGTGGGDSDRTASTVGADPSVIAVGLKHSF